MKKVVLFIGIGLLLWFAVIQSCNTPEAGEAADRSSSGLVSYNFDVRPILSDKCFACHGPDANKQEAGLRLDIAENAYSALKDNPDMHAIVPGKPELSEAYTRLVTKDPTLIMPPVSSNLTLTPREIRVIEKWIRQGAAYEKHWAFAAPVKNALPEIKDAGRAKNEIDYFIMQKLEQVKLTANPESDKERLLKRVSLDITGLPPTIEMMDKFLVDNSADAYEKIVDDLLQQPAYGEKMAIYWMDLARYADSHGFQDDNYRSQWPWRDWVIHAFNKNMPYNQFVTWQLAGDLLPNANKEQLLATSFNRNHKITEEGGVIQEEYRVEYVADRTNTFGKAFLGISFECARCHDHKYDPLSQKEYFQLFSFFNNIDEKGLESSNTITVQSFSKNPQMEISNEDVKTILHFVQKKDTNTLKISIMGELKDSVRKAYVLNRGAYDAHGEEVKPGTPQSIMAFDAKYSPDRTGLSEWLFDTNNPLTARIFVNQMWQEFFGKGIVRTASDFGMQGALPTHPALLDWLAVDFMESGWDVKRLIKKLVMSATYRQSSVITPEKLERDPDNNFLARASRHRVKAELVRDIVLSSSGLLVKKIGGPSVKHYQPKGLWETATSGRGILATYIQDRGESLYRRGLYTLIKRTVLPPQMSVFDASKREVCETGRLTTNTPLQALIMMNDPTVLEAARVLATALQNEQSATDEKITKAFRLIICRKPKEEELKILKNLYEEQVKTLDAQKAKEMLQVGEYPKTVNTDDKLTASLMQVVCTIYNMEEAISRS
ncbi:MAG: PSD1 domain-containing protein [Chitinophagaceae bacterium]|nr:PSD1 domain-containing protein [Chitinophagaceae bacterium]